jgi:hypothetical protein
VLTFDHGCPTANRARSCFGRAHSPCPGAGRAAANQRKRRTERRRSGVDRAGGGGLAGHRMRPCELALEDGSHPGRDGSHSAAASVGRPVEGRAGRPQRGRRDLATRRIPSRGRCWTWRSRGAACPGSASTTSGTSLPATSSCAAGTSSHCSEFSATARRRSRATLTRTCPRRTWQARPTACCSRSRPPRPRSSG